jgi:hypothetical protein
MLKWVAGGAALLAVVVAVAAIVVSTCSKPRMPGDELVVAMPDGTERRFSYDEFQKRESDLKSAQARLAKQEADLKNAQDELEALRRDGASGGTAFNRPVAGTNPKEDPKKAQPAVAQTDVAAENRRKAEKLIAEMDWDGFSVAMRGQMARGAEERRMGKKVPMSKEEEKAEQEAMVAWLGKMSEVSKLLGAKDFDQAMNDDIVKKRFEAAIMKAYGLDLSEEQTQAALVASGQGGGAMTLGNSGPSGSLDAIAKGIQGQIGFDEWVRTNVPGQYDSYRGVVGNSPFSSSNGGVKDIRTADQGKAVSDIAQFWKDSFGLNQACEPILQSVASDYYTECAVLKADYERTYGANIPRSANMEMVLKMVDAQKRAEARIGQALPLTPEQSESVKKTSGTFINVFSR